MLIARALSKAQDIAYAGFYGTLNAIQSLFPALRGRRFCNLCGRESALFYRHGIDSPASAGIVGGGIRKACVCPHCHSLDRYRWVYAVLERETSILTAPCRVLHIAPEAGIARKIASANPQCEYVTGDIRPGKADRVVDVTRMSDFADASFDYIVMNHVLEHVQDEAAAIAEIQRCLKPDGTAALSFPVTLTRATYEDASIVTESERLRAYGQRDHCRLYGNDAGERLERYGFRVRKLTPADILTREEIERMSLIEDDSIFLCAR